MSHLAPESQGRLPSSAEAGRRSYGMSETASTAAPLSGLLFTGLLLAGLGALAWYYVGPDLRRYIKISRM